MTGRIHRRDKREKEEGTSYEKRVRRNKNQKGQKVACPFWLKDGMKGELLAGIELHIHAHPGAQVGGKGIQKDGNLINHIPTQAIGLR